MEERELGRDEDEGKLGELGRSGQDEEQQELGGVARSEGEEGELGSGQDEAQQEVLDGELTRCLSAPAVQ